MIEYLMEVRGLKKHFPIRGGLLRRSVASVKAVDGIDIRLERGKTHGLVGESGCGKTTAGRCMLMLTRPTEGSIYYKMPGEARERMVELEKVEAEAKGAGAKLEEAAPAELTEIRAKYGLQTMRYGELRKLRRELQIVFQDPFSSLNPRMLVKDIVGEPLKVHGVAKGEELLNRTRDMIVKVGLTEEHLFRFPHEFSGGQRQRIVVARALALNPDLVVLDEPTSALDVSVQAQILNLLNDLQKELGLTYLFVSHDLSTVRYMCDTVSVMYLGKIVETASSKELFGNPSHPYTQALLSVIPVPDPDIKRNKVVLSGDVPSPANPPPGCRFHTRCRYREAICEEKEPPLADKGDGHFVACHFR